MQRWWFVILCLGWALACGDEAGETPADLTGGADERASVTDVVNGADAAAAGPDAGADVAPAPDVPVNTPPTFAAPAPLSLDMGHSTTLDLNPLLGDAEDDDAALEVSWSADHVALQDDGDHVLYVVAPTDWHGSEVIDLTVTDSGGLTATAPLKVLVNEGTVVEPPLPECGETLFALDAGTDVSQVLLSGSFNAWAETADGAAVLADPDGDGTWEVTLVLEPGSYQYKFIVDGAWIPDPANPDTADDGFGGVNSVLEVPPCEE